MLHDDPEGAFTTFDFTEFDPPRSALHPMLLDPALAHLSLTVDASPSLIPDVEQLEERLL